MALLHAQLSELHPAVGARGGTHWQGPGTVQVRNDLLPLFRSCDPQGRQTGFGEIRCALRGRDQRHERLLNDGQKKKPAARMPGGKRQFARPDKCAQIWSATSSHKSSLLFVDWMALDCRPTFAIVGPTRECELNSPACDFPHNAPIAARSHDCDPGARCHAELPACQRPPALLRNFRNSSENFYSPSFSLLPPSCFSFAKTALTSSSPGFFSGSTLAAISASLRAVVSAAGSNVAPVSTGAGFSLLARCTSKSRSICEARPSVTGSMGVRLAEFQCVRSRIEAIVDLVVPTSRMIALSLSSGWLRTSHRMAFGRS